MTEERRGNGEWIEIARVIGRDDEGSARRQVPDASDIQAEQHTHDNPVDGVEEQSQQRQKWTGGWCQPRAELLFLRADSPYPFRRLPSFVQAAAEQIADRVDGGDVCLGQPDAQAILQRDRELHPGE